MKKKLIKKDKPKVSRFVYWTPRILSIVFLLFLASFSLDVFDGNYGFWGTILALLMHNIPVLILLIILFIAWKHEIVGAVAFILAGLAYAVQVSITMIKTGFEWYYMAWAIQISGIAFFIGIMFWINWKKKKIIY